MFSFATGYTLPETKHMKMDGWKITLPKTNIAPKNRGFQ